MIAKKTTIIRLITCITNLLILNGCDSISANGKTSSDIMAFREVIVVEISINSIKWETFGTPENTSRFQVPGPTDYIILVAEFQSNEAKTILNIPPGDHFPVAPEAPRPWLDANFRNLLKQGSHSSVDLTKKSSCRPLKAIRRLTNKPVAAFLCSSGSKVLMYARVVDFTVAPD